MSIEDYRNRLEQRVAEASAAPPARGMEVAARVGGVEAAGEPEEAATVPVALLQQLADPNEEPSARLVALGQLKLLAISSPTFADWRPAFLAALRSAVEVPELRTAALEALIQERDRSSQERLLAGLRGTAEPLVPVDEALRLLSADPHADVREVARAVAEDPPSEAAHRQALKVLAGDPGSTELFKSLLADRSQTAPVRKLAATALNNLAPEELQPAAARAMRRSPGAAEAAEEAAEDIDLARHVEALLRARP